MKIKIIFSFLCILFLIKGNEFIKLKHRSTKSKEMLKSNDFQLKNQKQNYQINKQMSWTSINSFDYNPLLMARIFPRFIKNLLL